MTRRKKPLTADDVRAARGRLGMSQAQLAAALGVTVRTVSRWETGGVISEPEILRLALSALLSSRLKREEASK